MAYGKLDGMGKKPSSSKPAKGKKPPSELKLAVMARLRAVQAEMKKSDRAMGEFLCVGRTSWGQWITEGGNMPAEEAMLTLCNKVPHLTFEWIYRGKFDLMPVHLALRLELRVEGIDPDAATDEQREAVAQRIVAATAI